MKNTGFDKAMFKSAVTFNVKNMFRRTIDEATPQQIFQAVAYTVKDDIIDQWMTTHKEYEKRDVKTLYYLSMEFLMGTRCSIRKWRFRTSGSMFPGFSGNFGLSGIWLWYPLPLWYV